MECNEFGRLMFDGKIVYCKDGDNLIPYWQGVTEEGLEKFVRDYAERGTEGFADFIICQNGEVLETIGDYCKRMNIEIKLIIGYGVVWTDELDVVSEEIWDNGMAVIR